tara:strand:- start:404 stop:1399 length:996 start_codon:yes stop_codon:yes gene_type:complete
MRHLPLSVLTSVLSLTLVAGIAAQDKVVITDPAKINDDYRFQGEYLGDFKKGDALTKIGVQVIAMGKGTFQFRIHADGLPGAGWKRGDDMSMAKGTRNGKVVNVTTDEAESYDCRLKDGVMILSAGDRLLGKLNKVERTSKTLGKEPPSGAVVLFDGTEKSAANFTRGQIVMENLLRHDCESTEKFGDHHLHLEFRTPFIPAARGQGRGNSGMYVQGRYEVQVLDSFGLDGKNNECGGIYSISEPIVNMCLPPLVWQTYDYDFTAARYDDAGKKVKNGRITLWHNGVVIHDDLELTHGTPGKHPEAAGPGILYLQGHGNPVVYRNIWAVKK